MVRRRYRRAGHTHAARGDTRDDTIERLRSWRAGVARGSGILPDAVLTDRTLATIAEHRPTTPDELDELTGIGSITSRRLFDGIAAALA